MVERLSKHCGRVLEYYDFPDIQSSGPYFQPERDQMMFVVNSANESLNNSANQSGISNLLNKENALKPTTSFNGAASFLVPQAHNSQQIGGGMDTNNIFLDMMPASLNEQMFQERSED